MGHKTFDIEQDLFSYSTEVEPEGAAEQTVEGENYVRALFAASDFALDRRFFLKTEAVLLKLAYAHNKILSLSNSRTRILAHQVESTHRIVESLSKRFLIADEVGLGKTVEAGLVIKEFVYRYGYRRILIVCPASLLFQWQNEMLSKFNESFTIIDRKVLKKAAHSSPEDNPWLTHDKVICSIDFIKNKSFAEDLERTKWDAVIFDEAHRLRRDSAKSTIAYGAAEIIAENARSLLLLSATPFRGKIEELYYLIALVDENLLGPFATFYNEYCMEGADLSTLKQKLATVVIRRTKREVGGFTLRHARTIQFELYPNERLLYDEATKYVAEEFNRALQTENRAVGFVMTVFQKLLDSSSYALLMAFRNRRKRLEEMVERMECESAVIDEYYDSLDPEVIDSAEDVDTLVESSLKKTATEMKEEVRVLGRLIKLAESVRENKKGEKLREIIAGLKKSGSKKFLIFTQFKTTQDFLCKLLSDYSVIVFNGSMDRDAKEQAIIDFKERAEILIATEAGGEGRNLQFCNILINYDLPWSPLKIEQRIGRIHRFGQPKDVYIYNFSTRDTVADRVLEVLNKKLKLFEESIGAPDILLGEIEDELKLGSLFMEMVSGRKSRRDVDSEIDERIQNARKSYEKLAELTVARRMDFNYDEYYEITLKERQFSNKRIERFVNDLQAVDESVMQHVGRKHPKNNLYPIPREGIKGVKGSQGTFNSQTALDNENLEFLAFGHPIIDMFIERCRSGEFGGTTGIRLIKYYKPFIGVVVNYLVTFQAEARSQELIPVVVSVGGDDDAYLLDDIEDESVDQDYIESSDISVHEHVIHRIAAGAESFFDRARERLLRKIEYRINDMVMNLDVHIDPEIEKIRTSFDRTIKELEDKLQLQEGQMKWYGKDMRGAITRTRNLIMKAERKKEMLLKKYRGYTGIRYTVEMLNAGIIIAER